jgi:putative acetyltransferase
VQLRSFYAHPSRVLLALDADSAPLALVALLVTGQVGEVRRLYVTPSQRTGGLGRRLVETLVDQANALGLNRLVLNTLPTMLHAQVLYRSLGFVETEPYVEKPTDGILYFQLLLKITHDKGGWN